MSQPNVMKGIFSINDNNKKNKILFNSEKRIS